MNKRLNKIGVMFIMLAVVVMIFAATALANVAVEDITISQTSPTSKDIVFGTNTTVSFSATVSPSNATDKSVTWVSTNTNVLKLKTGSTNPHTSAVFDVIGLGSTDIIAVSNVGTNTVVKVFEVDVVDLNLSTGEPISTILLWDSYATNETTSVSNGETFKVVKETVSSNSFSIYLTARFEDGKILTFDEIKKYITFLSDNSSKIWFEDFEQVVGYNDRAKANFRIDGSNDEIESAELMAYAYDGHNIVNAYFNITTEPALTLTQKATASADGLSASYQFTHSPILDSNGENTSGNIVTASNFDRDDFRVQYFNGSTFITDTNISVADLDWNESSKILKFYFNMKLSPTYIYRVIPVDAVSENFLYYREIDGNSYKITYEDITWQQFTGPGTVDSTTLSLTPSTTSVDFSTDSDRILYATTGKAGTFTIEAASTAAENAQFNIENTGSLPSGVTFKNVGDGKTATVSVPSNLAAGTYYINVKAQYLDGTTPSSIIIEKTFELRVGTLGTFNVSNVTLTKSNSAIPVIQTSSPVKSVNGDTIAATYKFYGGASVDRIEHTIVSLDGQFNHSVTGHVLATAQNHLASSAGYVMSYKIGDGATGGKLDLGTYIMRVELFDGDNSLGITEVRFSVDTSFEMLDVRVPGDRGIGVYYPNQAVSDVPSGGNFQYDKTTGKYINISSTAPDAVQRRSANEYQSGAPLAVGDTLYFFVAVDGYDKGDRIKFYIDDFVFGANKGGGLTAQTVEVQEWVGVTNYVAIPFTIKDTTYLGTHVVQIKMAKTLDGIETFDHEINLKYDLESEYLTTEVEIYDELKNLAGKREIKIDSDLHITRTLFIPEDRVLILECGNTLTIDPLRHVTVYGEIRMNENALLAEGSLVVTGKVALCADAFDHDSTIPHSYYYYASSEVSDNPYLLITDGSNITMTGTLVDGYTNMLTGSAVMDTKITTFGGGTIAEKDLSVLASEDSFVLAQNGSQVTLSAGNLWNISEGAKLTVGSGSQFINEGRIDANRASIASLGDLITRKPTGAATNAEIFFKDVNGGTVPFISSAGATGQFFLGDTKDFGDASDPAGKTYPFDLVPGAVAISGTDYNNFDYKIFGNVEMNQDLNISSAQELTIEQDSLLWIREGTTPPGYTLKLDGALHNKGALWVDGRAYGDGKYIEYVDSELAGNGSIELNGATNVLGAITGDVKLQKTLTGGYKITIPENGSANIVANFKMNSNDELIVAAGATLTVNSGIVFEVDGKVAIEPSKVDGGISYSEGTFNNNGTTTFGFGDDDDTSGTSWFTNLGTMTGTFGVKTSDALNSLVIQYPGGAWHAVNGSNNGISPNCAILLVGVNKIFETPGNWDLSYRVSNEVYASKNITFTGGGIGNTTIEVTATAPIISATTATTADEISKQTAKASNIAFGGIKFEATANASEAVLVEDNISSTDLSFEGCEFTGFISDALRFEKSDAGTDNVTGLEVTNCEFNGTGIYANKLSNSVITGSSFDQIDQRAIWLNYQGLKNSSGSDLYISGVELTDNIFSASTATGTTGIRIGGQQGAYIGEIEVSGSTFTGFETGVRIVTPEVASNKSNNQITLKDLLITTSTFNDCTTAIHAINSYETTTPAALTPNNMLGTITYVKCTTKVDDPNNVFTFLVTSEQTLNEALSMSINNISMANSFSVSGSIHISDKNLTVPSGMTLTVNSSSTFRTSGTAQINVIGTIANSGTLNVGGTSFGGTGRINTLTTGKVEGTKPIIMKTETVGGTSVRGTIDGIFFGDVTVQKNSSNGTFIIGVATDGYATANANYTLPVGSKLVGGSVASEFEIVSGVTITVLGEVEETYDYNSLYGNGILSFAPGSTLTRKGSATDNTTTPNTISATEVIGDKGYLSFDRDITTTRLNRKGDNSTGYTYILASGKMSVDAESTLAEIPYLVDDKNSLQVSTGANITVLSGHTFVVKDNGLVMANQTGYGTLIGVDRNSHASIHEGSSFGSISGPSTATGATADYIWAVNKWASETDTAGEDAAPAGIGEDFAGNAETVYFTPDMDAGAINARTTTGDLTIPAGRTLVIAANSDLVVGSTYTLFINGDVTFETDANIVGEDASAQMEVARGKSVVLGGITYGEGEYIWDSVDKIWVNNVYDQKSLENAMNNPTVKVSRAIKSFSVTSSVTVESGYRLYVDATEQLTVNENVTLTVAGGGSIVGRDDSNTDYYSIVGLSHKSKLTIRTGAEVKQNSEGTTQSMTFGVIYAWNKLKSPAEWTASAESAELLSYYFNAGREVIASESFSLVNGTAIINNLYIPDGITLTVPSAATVTIEGDNPDYINTTSSGTKGKLIGSSSSSRLIVTGTSPNTGNGKDPGSYVWIGTGLTGDWMKVASTWQEVVNATASDTIYFLPSSNTTTVTTDAVINAKVTISAGKTVTINPGITVTIDATSPTGAGAITLESGASIKGYDSSSVLDLTGDEITNPGAAIGGTYPNLTTGRNYAWYNNAWHRLVEVGEMETIVPSGTTIVVKGDGAITPLDKDVSVAGTLVIQKGTVLELGVDRTLEVRGTLVDGWIKGADNKSPSKLQLITNRYTPETGYSIMYAGEYIWTDSSSASAHTWKKTVNTQVGPVGQGIDVYFESGVPITLKSFVIEADSSDKNTGEIYLIPGTEIILDGLLYIQNLENSTPLAAIRVWDTTTNNWIALEEIKLTDGTAQIKGVNSSSQIVVGGGSSTSYPRYQWNPTAQEWVKLTTAP